jgi:SAM-dependent methyltransferase
MFNGLINTNKEAATAPKVPIRIDVLGLSRETDILRSVPFPQEFSSSKEGNEIRRALFQLSLLTDRIEPPFSMADLGAGMGLFSIACAEAGLDVTNVDDYRDPVNFLVGAKAVNVLRSHGVKIIERDVFDGPLPFSDNSLDAICSIDSMEHWHQSPKSLFAQCVRILRPGGVFLLGAPNCVNLRKRITVPLGYGKWTQMADWYEQERFRGHVREPDVDDLRYIATGLGLVDVAIYGRNWTGWSHRRRIVRLATRLADPLLRRFPSLCSDIYVVGRKPLRRYIN